MRAAWLKGRSLRRAGMLFLLLMICGACTAPQVPPTPTVPPAARATAPPSSPRPTRPPATPTPQPGPSPTPPPRPLTLWAAEEGPALEMLNELVATFAREVGRPVFVQSRPPAALRPSLISAELIGAPPPDLIWGDQDDLAELLSDGVLQPVEPPLQSARFLPAALEGATAEQRLWGVPVLVQGGLLLYYNRAIVPEAPATTEQLLAVARAAGNRERFGLLMPWGQPRWTLALLDGFGGAPTDPAGNRPTLDTPEMLAALDLLLKLRATLVDDPPPYGRGQRIFGLGYAGLMIDGDWALSTYRSYSQTLDLGIAPLPPPAERGRPVLGQLGGSYLMLHRDMDRADQDLAMALGAFLTRPEIQVQLALAAGRLPARRDLLDDPAIRADPLLGLLAAHAEQARGLPPTPAMRCALAAIEIRLGWLFAGDLDRQQTASAMQRDAEACATP